MYTLWDFNLSTSCGSFSETYCHAVHLAEHCVYCNAVSCGSDISGPFSSWWKHLKASPLLEFYIRVWFTFLECFDIIQQHDVSAVKALEISLKLKRHLLRKHDYVAYMGNINGALPVVISPACLACIGLSYHVVALSLIAFYALQMATYAMQSDNPTGYHSSITPDLISAPTPNTLFNCQSCQTTKLSSSTTDKIVGGGISKIFTLEELHSYIDDSISAEKFKFLSYLSQASAVELQDTDDFLVSSTIPLSNLVPKLTISDLKVIAKCHGLAIHSKMKSQDIQTALTSHICTSCQEHVSIFQIIDEPGQSQKSKAANLKAANKYQAIHSKKYKALRVLKFT